MATKQINLRGISRTPSDRMTPDGGCAESLNVHIEENEVVPTLPPKPLKTELGLTGDVNKPPVFIHQTSRSKRIILEYKHDGHFEIGYNAPSNNSLQYTKIFDLDGEEVVDYASIGNVLIVTTDKHAHYSRWDEKTNTYTYLGTRIPEPIVEFLDEAATSSDNVELERTAMNVKWDSHNQFTYDSPSNAFERFINGFQVSLSGIMNGIGLLFYNESEYIPSDVMLLKEDVWNDALAGIISDETETDQDSSLLVVAGIVNTIWDSIKVLINNNRAKGFFCVPLFARYAIKLYDGQYIYQSVPVLLGSIGSAYLKDRKTTLTYQEEVPGGLGTNRTWEFDAKVSFERFAIHKVKAKMLSTEGIENWKDLVQSIDIFLSADIYFPSLTSKFVRLTTEITDRINPNVDQYGVVYDEGHTVIGSLELEDALPNEEETAVTGASNFYLVASYSIDKIEELVAGVDITPVEQDKLLTLPTLPDDQSSHHEITASRGTMVYNERLLSIGANVKLYSGSPTFPSLYKDAQSGHSAPPGRNYAIIFEVLDEDGNAHEVFTDLEHYGAYTAGILPIGELASCDSYAWIAYPDTRCRKATIVYQYLDADNRYMFSYPMKEHPLLNCSYCFIGFGNSLFDPSVREMFDGDPTYTIDNDAAVYTDRRKLLLSEHKNPFIFPIKYRQSMPADIIDVATTTRALSPGQLGQFDLYVFATDGIYALPISKMGTIVGISPISREVAIGHSVSPVDQAIIFVTERGVMMLSESDITELSANMHGKHYELDDDAADIIEQKADGWDELLPAMQDDSPFMAFMKDSTVMYDYAGRRLICFNADFDYQYVYMLQTGTWHKLYTPGVQFYRKLNSDPEAWVTAIADNEAVVMNYSTFLDTERSDTIKGAIVTRPIDFDAPDMRKALIDLRQRGVFHKGCAKYILLGSMDGYTWGRLKTLRGGSYKLFRIVILLDLEATDRLSWLEADVETRFPNKLR